MFGFRNASALCVSILLALLACFLSDTGRQAVSLLLLIARTWARDSSTVRRAIVHIPNAPPFVVREMDGHRFNGRLTFEEVQEITEEWTTPIILRKFFETSDDACDICSNDAFLRTVLVDSGIPIGTILDQAAGIYSRIEEHLRRICVDQQDLYLFNYPHYASFNQTLWAKTNALVKNIYEFVGVNIPHDDAFSYNELLLGYNSKDFHFPARRLANIYGGSPFHNAPVGNVFLQFCGTKTWYFMSPATNIDVPTEINGIISSIFTITEKNIDEMSVRYNMSKVVVRPGDAILNPPYVWHAVVAHKGITFSTTHKFRAELVLPSMLSRPDLYAKQLAQLVVWAGRLHDNNIVKKVPFDVDEALARVKVDKF